ncbi:hypothetical protein, partial [Delftia acidovorans]|uniref:hypothetical protein n=1 Tax=Delftia acidovorans TaxID=80866 RepID=UPI0035A03FBF
AQSERHMSSPLHLTTLGLRRMNNAHFSAVRPGARMTASRWLQLISLLAVLLVGGAAVGLGLRLS